MAAAMSGSVSASERMGLILPLAVHGLQSSVPLTTNQNIRLLPTAYGILQVTKMSSVVITARGEQRLRTGHPWIYRADVSDVDASGGDIVEVIGPRRRTLGHALFSDRSQIPIRMLV